MKFFNAGNISLIIAAFFIIYVFINFFLNYYFFC